MKLLIVGGVAGGASAAAAPPLGRRRLHRPVRAWAGRVVRQLRLALLRRRGDRRAEQDAGRNPRTPRVPFRLDVRVRSSVEAIDRPAKKVRVRDLASGREYEEAYDKLILAPGAAPLRPPIPGIDLPGVSRCQPTRRGPHQGPGGPRGHAGGRGGGGVHRTRNGRELRASRHRGHSGRIAGPSAAAFDKEMTTPLAEHLATKGVSLLLGQSAEAFERGPMT